MPEHTAPDHRECVTLRPLRQHPARGAYPTVMVKRPYPRVIIKCRYGGVDGYEGGDWAAFPCFPDQIPEDAQGDDVPCQQWWEAPTLAAGVGSTPDEALRDLEIKISRCEHPGNRLRIIPAHTILGHCAPTTVICDFCTAFWHET